MRKPIVGIVPAAGKATRLSRCRPKAVSEYLVEAGLRRAYRHV